MPLCVCVWTTNTGPRLACYTLVRADKTSASRRRTTGDACSDLIQSPWTSVFLVGKGPSAGNGIKGLGLNNESGYRRSSKPPRINTDTTLSMSFPWARTSVSMLSGRKSFFPSARCENAIQALFSHCFLHEGVLFHFHPENSGKRKKLRNSGNTFGWR